MAAERIARSAPGSAATEAFRFLRTGLAGLLPSGLKGSAILVTSARHGEGRSTVVSNLATVIARSGLTVLVVDADSVAPSQQTVFGVERAFGFAEMMADDTVADRVVQRTVEDRLAVLAAGTDLTANGDLLASPRAAALIRRLRGLADVVIIDSGPLLQVSDAAMLAEHCDLALLVAHAAVSTRDEVVLARQQLAATGILQAAVVNAAPSSWGLLPAGGRRPAGPPVRHASLHRHDVSAGGWLSGEPVESGPQPPSPVPAIPVEPAGSSLVEAGQDQPARPVDSGVAGGR